MSPKEELENRLFGGLDTVEHRVVEECIHTTKLHRGVLEKHLNKTGVYRSQHQLLMYIFCHPNASQKELARLYNVSTATVAVSLKKLERGGYIERLVDQEDNRFNQIRITQKGREVVEKSVSFFCEVERGMFSGFSEAELEKLYGYIRRVHENLKKIPVREESEEHGV